MAKLWILYIDDLCSLACLRPRIEISVSNVIALAENVGEVEPLFPSLDSG